MQNCAALNNSQDPQKGVRKYISVLRELCIPRVLFDVDAQVLIECDVILLRIPSTTPEGSMRACMCCARTAFLMKRDLMQLLIPSPPRPPQDKYESLYVLRANCVPDEARPYAALDTFPSPPLRGYESLYVLRANCTTDEARPYAVLNTSSSESMRICMRCANLCCFRYLLSRRVQEYVFVARGHYSWWSVTFWSFRYLFSRGVRQYA